jgi:hypothetical protein
MTQILVKPAWFTLVKLAGGIRRVLDAPFEQLTRARQCALIE